MPFLIRLAMVLTATIAFLGCASSSDDRSPSSRQRPASIVYPPAPAPPVIEWVAAYGRRSDVAQKAENRWRKILVGEEDREDQLQAPTAVAIGPDGTLWVVDQRLRAVVAINPATERFELFSGNGPARLTEPNSVAVAADGRLFVSDAAAHAVYIFDSSMKYVKSLGQQEKWTRPTGIALSADDRRLAVADTRGHRVTVLDVATGDAIFEVGTGEPGREPSEFHFPVAVAIDQQDYLYVADFLNFRIQVFGPDGDHELSFGEAGDLPGKLNRPRAVAADSEAGVIYEADAAFQLVQMFNLDGELLMWFGQPGDGPAEFGLPTGIARRGSTLAIADTLNSRVQVFRFLGPPAAD